jgi:hypothetical protein
VAARCACAQQAGKVYRIGFLANYPTIPSQSVGKAFVDGLRENGSVDGRNSISEAAKIEGMQSASQRGKSFEPPTRRHQK